MSTTTEVMQVTTALAQFDKVAAGLAELEKSYKGIVYTVSTKEGMKAAVEARRAIKGPRVEVEKLRKAAKAPILELGRKLDSEAGRIIGALEAIEDPIDEQIKNEENRLHDEAVAKATAERERVEALEARLANIQTMPYDANGASVATCKAILDEARSMVIGEDWQEFREKAKGALVVSVASLEGVLAKAVQAEADAARIIAERAELELARAELAKRDAAERERQAVEAEKVATELKEETERLAAHSRKLRDQNDALAAERLAFEQEKARVAVEQAERIRIEQVNFRAHHERLTPAEKSLLLAASNTWPDADVYSLVIPPAIQESLKVEDVQAMCRDGRAYGLVDGNINIYEAIEVPPLTEAITVAKKVDIEHVCASMAANAADEDKERAAFEAKGWTRTCNGLPEDETPVLIVVKGRRRIGVILWETPGYEDTHKATQYWVDPDGSGQDWEWDDVTHWAPLLEFNSELERASRG